MKKYQDVFSVSKLLSVWFGRVVLIFDYFFIYHFLSYEIAIIQWITSCHKDYMATRVIILWCVHVTSLTSACQPCVFVLK